MQFGNSVIDVLSDQCGALASIRHMFSKFGALGRVQVVSR